MRITRVTLRDIRTHRGTRELELARGLTVIRGPNEAGKSTFLRALELALTRRVTSTAGDLDGLRTWGAPDERRPEVALDFELEDEDGVRTGRLEKTFRGARGTVRLEVDGEEPITDPTAADERLAELTGIPSEAFFRATASVRHHELAAIAKDEAALRDRLQASISGADRGTSAAKRRLERALLELERQGQKHPGLLKAAEERLADTRGRLALGDAALEHLERDREALALAREVRAEVGSTLGEARAMLDKARIAERLDAERRGAQDRYGRYRQAVEVSAEIDRLEAGHPSPSPLPVLRQAVERLRVLDRRILELTSLLTDEVDTAFELAAPPRWRPLLHTGIVLLVLGALVSAAGLVAVGVAPVALGGLLVVLGVVLVLVGVWLRRSDRLDAHLRDEQVTRRLRGRSEMEAELRQAQADTRQQLGALGLEDLAAAEVLLGREHAHVAAIDHATARLEGLLGGEVPDDLTDRRDASALEVEQKTSAIDALGPIAKEPRARERLEVEVAEAERAMERARDDEAAARARVEQNQVDAEAVASLAEEAAAQEERLSELRRRARVYRTTRDAIETAEKATMETATRYLERRMVGDLEWITGGRYRRVRVDDTNLGIEVWAPERDDWVPVTDLSQGTLDIVYLAARLGLVRLVTGDRRPPLVLDDPFVTLDDRRATHALELLRTIADDLQVIVLTTSPRYDHLADRVIELPGPAEVDDAPAPRVEAGVHG